MATLTQKKETVSLSIVRQAKIRMSFETVLPRLDSLRRKHANSVAFVA